MKARNFVNVVALAAFSATASPSLAVATLGTSTNGLVQIITPQDGENILLGQSIHICALTQSFTDAVSTVEFFAGTKSLGIETNQPLARHSQVGGNFFGGMPPAEEFGGFHQPWPTGGNIFSFIWTNAMVGSYALTAQATDAAGNTVISAPVTINVVTDLPPVISIVQPANGSFLLGPANISLKASAFDPDGTVVNVEFFAGAKSLGIVTNPPPVWVTNRHGVFPIRQTSYSLIWSNVPLGAYTLTAVATDNAGVSTTSSGVQVTLVTNLPPVVRLVEPELNEQFYSPATISLTAAAHDPDGSVASVEFFSGTQSLGVETSGVSVTNRGGAVWKFFTLTISNVAPGTYTYSAVATDNDGAAGTSPAIQVTVVTPPPPLVQIVYPKDGATFVPPASVPIATVTRYFTQPIASVQFLAGTNILDISSNSWWPTFHWKNVPAGAYSLTAVGTDKGGISATSAPVNITVTTNSSSVKHGAH